MALTDVEHVAVDEEDLEKEWEDAPGLPGFFLGLGLTFLFCTSSS